MSILDKFVNTAINCQIVVRDSLLRLQQAVCSNLRKTKLDAVNCSRAYHKRHVHLKNSTALILPSVFVYLEDTHNLVLELLQLPSSPCPYYCCWTAPPLVVSLPLAAPLLLLLSSTLSAAPLMLLLLLLSTPPTAAFFFSNAPDVQLLLFTNLLLSYLSISLSPSLYSLNFCNLWVV